MSKPNGYHFYCIVENNKLISTKKLLPQTMLDLVRYVIKQFGDEDYDSVVDLFDYWPVDFTAKYTKPVQYLYFTRDKESGDIEKGFIVYARNKTNAEKAMQDWLDND
jgi:hypothetical protein